MIVAMNVPFFRPDLGDDEIAEVVATLRSGWLTTGPRVARFEEELAAAVEAPRAVALSSCTAAMHLATAALGLARGDAVLVPAMTFAATAEVVCYPGATPVLVDCDPRTLNVDLEDAERKLERLARGELPGIPAGTRAVGFLPVHVGGHVIDGDALQEFARRHDLWLVEDAAHAFPAAWRRGAGEPWQPCGSSPSAATCFSFYANKTITTGEGGMATSHDDELVERMRSLSLHGLSNDAWGRYTAKGSWDYRILAPGYKYNLTDLAAAIGLHQLARAESMRERREAVAHAYRERLQGVDELELPPFPEDRVHSWHLFPIRLRLERLGINRDAFLAALRERGIGYSVHWRPLHLHPYYQGDRGWRPEDCPTATSVWKRLVSLPIFPGMTEDELDAVVTAVRELCARHRPATSQARS